MGKNRLKPKELKLWEMELIVYSIYKDHKLWIIEWLCRKA